MIETKRVFLRPLTPDDAAAFYDYMRDAALCRGLGMDPVGSVDEARELLEACKSETYAVVWRKSGGVIGHFCIRPPIPLFEEDAAFRGKRGASLSCALRPDYQGRGIMTEVIWRVLDLLLRERGLDYVNAGYFAFNDASRRLQERFPFRHYRTYVLERGGEEIETVDGVLTREEYLKR